jgi:hypothetical protein
VPFAFSCPKSKYTACCSNRLGTFLFTRTQPFPCSNEMMDDRYTNAIYSFNPAHPPALSRLVSSLGGHSAHRRLSRAYALHVCHHPSIGIPYNDFQAQDKLCCPTPLRSTLLFAEVNGCVSPRLIFAQAVPLFIDSS